MRFALVALALVGTAAAQMNCFNIVPHKVDTLSPNDVADIVTRCSLAGGNDMCQEIPGDFFGCVGANASGTQNLALGHCIRLDDFNGSTPDGYEIVVRPRGAAGTVGPDCTAANELCRVGPQAALGAAFTEGTVDAEHARQHACHIAIHDRLRQIEGDAANGSRHYRGEHNFSDHGILRKVGT